MAKRRTCPACKSGSITCVSDPDGVWMECDDCGNFGYLD